MEKDVQEEPLATQKTAKGYEIPVPSKSEVMAFKVARGNPKKG